MEGISVVNNLINRYDESIDLSKYERRILLKELRKTKINRPDIVLTLGPEILLKESNIELWSLHEQLHMAYTECGDFPHAEYHLSELKKKFPTSNRVLMLTGMNSEAQGEYQKALEIYNKSLLENSTNLIAMKRKICVLKSDRQIPQLLEELNKLLANYPSDADSWIEMSEVYLCMGDYEMATHCLEELVLINPLSAPFHSRLADTYYSMGGMENILNARRHYTASLNFQCALYNFRSLQGLMSSCVALRELHNKRATSGADTSIAGLNPDEARLNSELFRWGLRQFDLILTSTQQPAMIASMHQHFKSIEF